MELLTRFIVYLCDILIIVIIIRAILSWFSPKPGNPLMVILFSITEPILAPLRRIVPRIGLIDITPMVAIILLWLISWLATQLLQLQ